MYTGRFTPDSPLYLTDFLIVTNCVCVGVCCVRVYVDVCVCSFLLSCHSTICYLLLYFSVLLENLLFLYCCEGGWYLICRNIRLVAFVQQLTLISPYEKGWNLNEGKDLKRHISLGTCWHQTPWDWNLEVYTNHMLIVYLTLLFIYLQMWCYLPPSPSSVRNLHSSACESETPKVEEISVNTW